MILAGYDANGATVISWGDKYSMTWKFFGQFCDEIYGLIDQSWIESTGKTPAGLTLAQIESLMQAIKSVP